MFCLDDEIKSFEKKSIKNYVLPLNDLYEPMLVVQEKINDIDKTSKKTAMSIGALGDELEEKNEFIKSLKKELENEIDNEEKLFKKVILILDQLENLSRFAIQSQNEFLISNISSSMKIIKKELRDVGFEEIPTVGEIFNSNLHECVEAIENETKVQYEIVDVLKKGYMMNGKVIRIASVVAVK